MNFPPHLLDAVKKIEASAKEKTATLQAQAEESARIQNLWDDLSKYMSHGWPMHIRHFFEKEAPLLKKLRADNHPAIPQLDEIYRLAKEQANIGQRRFPNNLDKASQTAKLPLDHTSRHPRYTFEKGFFHLEVDERKGIARLSDNGGRLQEFPADVEAIVEIVQRERQRVFGRPFDGKKFSKQLRSHYLAVVKKEGERDGASIPIRYITRRFGKNIGLRTDEFLVDLSKLIEKGPLEVDGLQLDLQQTKDTNQGVLLPGVAGRGYIGFILYRKV